MSFLQKSSRVIYDALQMINNKKNQKYSGACANIGASFLPLAFEVFRKTSDEVLKLVHDLVEKAAEIKQLSFSHLLSYLHTNI